jgi:hypothetical protein
MIETKYYPIEAEFEDFGGEEKRLSYRFRRPTRMELERALKIIQDKSVRAMTGLCVDTVHPDEAERLKADMDEYPGLGTTFGNEILKRSGFVTGASLGKSLATGGEG